MQWLISFFPYAFIVANYYALINSHVSFHMSCVFLSLCFVVYCIEIHRLFLFPRCLLVSWCIFISSHHMLPLDFVLLMSFFLFMHLFFSLCNCFFISFLHSLSDYFFFQCTIFVSSCMHLLFAFDCNQLHFFSVSLSCT